METVGTAMLNEQPHLLPLAAEPFDLAEISFPTVDSLRCVRVRTNRYSVPLPPKFPGYTLRSPAPAAVKAQVRAQIRDRRALILIPAKSIAPRHMIQLFWVCHFSKSPLDLLPSRVSVHHDWSSN
jgi:hypothetical protein